MKRHDINFNRDPLSSEDIAQHRNFDQVLHRYQTAKNPFYKNKWLVSGTLASVVVAVLFFATFNFEGGTPGNLAFINPPLPQLNVSFASYTVDAGEAQEINYHTGTRIRIPANAFVDKDGQPVRGEVELRYREMHDAVDFFLSGIPMTYDSAGTQYTFESAGMMELVGYKDGEEVFIAEGKELSVDMASYQEGYYNVYELDQNAENWAIRGNTTAFFEEAAPPTEEDSQLIAAQLDNFNEQPPLTQTPEVQQLYMQMQQLQAQVADVEKGKPAEPQRANEDRYRFNIDVDEQEFPEIALWEGVYFEVSDEDNSYDPELAQFQWDDVRLRKSQDGKQYIVSISRETLEGTERHAFLVVPVYRGDTYNTAMNVFEEKFAAYENRLEERKEEEAQIKAAYQAKLAEMEAERIAQQREWEAKMAQWKKEQEQALTANASRQKVQRAFTVSNFGIWNCDRPQKFPKGNAVLAQFEDKDNNKLNLNYVYLAEKERNAMFYYTMHGKGEITYNPSRQNMIWGITKDNKLAVYRAEDFAAMEHQPGAYTFKMETVEADFSNVDEVKAYLNI